jgi:import receptor subunit TOM20
MSFHPVASIIVPQRTVADMSSGSPLLTASLATLGAGIAVYLAWFDYRRRNDIDFRRELRRGERRHQRVLREETEREKTEERDQIRRMVLELDTTQLPVDLQSRQDVMLAEIEAGQKLLDTGGDEKEAAFHFYKALMVAADKTSICSVYDEQLPKPILNLLSIMIAANPKFSTEQLGLGSGASSVNIPSAGLD